MRANPKKIEILYDITDTDDLPDLKTLRQTYEKLGFSMDKLPQFLQYINSEEIVLPVEKYFILTSLLEAHGIEGCVKNAVEHTFSNDSEPDQYRIGYFIYTTLYGHLRDLMINECFYSTSDELHQSIKDSINIVLNIMMDETSTDATDSSSELAR